MKKEEYVELVNKKLKTKIKARDVTKSQARFMYELFYDDETFQLRPDDVEEDQPIDQVLEKGDYQISFDLKLLSKRDEVEEVHVSEAVKLDKRKRLESILNDLSFDFINKYKNASAYDILEQVNIDVRDRDEAMLLKLKMKQTLLHYKVLSDNMTINTNPGQCVLDYIMEEITRSGNMVKYDRQKLIHDMGEEGVWMGYSIEDIMRWARSKKDVSAYALDIFNDCVDFVSSAYPRLNLVFKINEDHCFGVFEKELKSMVSHTKKLNLQRQLFQYSYNEPYVMVESVDDYLKYDGDAKIVYINTITDLSRLAQKVTLETGFLLEYGHYRNASLDMFQHPVKGHIAVAAYDYHERFAIADDLLKETKYVGFRWTNQTYMKLAQSLMQLRVGKITKSYYSPDLQEIMNLYPMKPWIVQVSPFEQGDKPKAFDRCKCYTEVMMNFQSYWNVFSMYDDAEPFTGKKIVPGEYILKHPVWIADKTILIERGVPHNVVSYLLEEEYITLDDIGYVIKASKALEPETFKPLLEEMIRRWPKNYKHLVNHLIGSFNQKYTKTTDVAMTTSFETALATQMHYPNEHIKMAKVGDVWFLRKEHQDEKQEGMCPIWRQIIGEGIINLDRMHRAIVGPNTRVLSYNTDSITVVNPREDFVPVPKADAKPGDICAEHVKHLRGTPIEEIILSEEYVYNPAPWRKRTKDEIMETGESCMVTGMPGSRKSTMLKELFEDDLLDNKKVAVVSVTNTAAANVRRDDVAVKGVTNSHTLDSFFPKESSRANWKAKVADLDVVMMDEGSMTQKKWFEFLRQAYTDKKFLFRLFQDSNQCHAIEEDNMWYDYMDSKAIRLMCDQNLCDLEYQQGRYDSVLHSELVSFIETRTLSENWKQKRLFTPEECDFNIVMTKKTRDTLNTKWYTQRSVGKNVVKINNMSVFVGMPLISYVNLKSFNIWNSERYYIKSIKTDYIELERDGELRSLARSELKSPNFLYGYADTVYRVQGATLRFAYNVHEVGAMTWNNLYVALSRPTTMDSIGIKFTSREFVKQMPPKKGRIVAPTKVTLSDCYIYKIHDGEYMYIGRTNKPERRFLEHLENPTSEKMSAWLAKGGQSFDIIDSFTYIETKEMNALEEWYIGQLDAEKSMNTQNVKKVVEAVKPKIELKIDDDRFKIADTGSSYRMQWRDDGKRREKELKYNVHNHDQQLQKMQEFRRELIKMFYR